ncbi:hypothetical protein LIER_28379 [Lithospermum erythrorhizon]|uniref:Uncharacterized protein n=1 Tax=Lithospermum erythrorhizon TaxID=34254 RepID=A0AAV3RJN0_LITER
MESNVDPSMVKVTDAQMVPSVVSRVVRDGIDYQNIPAFVPGVPGVTLPVTVVPAVFASGGGGCGQVPPAFATTVTLPHQPPTVTVM